MKKISKIVAMTLPMALAAMGASAMEKTTTTTTTTTTPSMSSTATAATDAAKSAASSATTAATNAATTATKSATTTAAANTNMGGNMDVVETASGAAQFSTLTKAIAAAGLTETLKGNGPYTIFAPTDAAFAKLGEEKLEELMKPENKAKLADILKYHVVSGTAVPSTAAQATPTSLTSVEGGKLSVSRNAKGVMVQNASVTSADIKAKNGIIHQIDTVLIPEATSTPAAAPAATTPAAKTSAPAATATETKPATNAPSKQ